MTPLSLNPTTCDPHNHFTIKETKVRPIEGIAKTPHTMSALFTMLRGPLHARGSGASSLTPAFFFTIAAAFALIALAASLAFSATPALAAEASCSGLKEPFRKYEEQVRVERGSSALPDCRAYEMVTPPQKNGGVIGETFFNIFALRALVAANGERVIAASIQCFAQAPSCVGFRKSEGEPYSFTRGAAGGWATTPLAPPGSSFETSTYWSLNAEAGTAMFTAPTPPHGSLESLYALGEDGSPHAIGPDGELTKIGGRLAFEVFGEGTLRSTADLSHVVYQTNAPAWSFDAAEAGSLYEYVGVGNAAPLLVGVSGPKESHALISACGARIGGGGTKVNREALSADGRTVYFTAVGHDFSSCPSTSTAPAASALYARIDGERADARSVAISAPTLGVCTAKECEENTDKAKEAERFRAASYEGASTDGSRVFFASTQQLTNGASESSTSALLGCNTVGGPGGCNLYESECEGCEELANPGPEEHAKRRLIDVSEGAKEHGGPRVQGVVAISADGSHVYFIAKGKLTGEEQNQIHEVAQEEAENLYVYERDNAFPQGRLAFVTTLSPADEREWIPEPAVASVTPDGRFLAFTSHRALTADNTRSEGPAQVYEYDAQSKWLIRVSTGEEGFNDNGNSGSADARIVSQVAPAETVPVRSDTTMSADGKFVFFQSPVALTPGALNDVPAGELFAQNVYERHEGHVSLISDGKDTTPESRASVTPVELLGSDTSGTNVFFTTFDPLVPEDGDTQRDIYVARICSEADPCLPPVSAPAPSCEGEACQGSSSPAPSFSTPSSLTFSGEGNIPLSAVVSTPKVTVKKVTRCVKGKKLSHGKCVKNVKKKAKKAKKAVRRERRGKS